MLVAISCLCVIIRSMHLHMGMDAAEQKRTEWSLLIHMSMLFNMDSLWVTLLRDYRIIIRSEACTYAHTSIQYIRILNSKSYLNCKIVLLYLTAACGILVAAPLGADSVPMCVKSNVADTHLLKRWPFRYNDRFYTNHLCGSLCVYVFAYIRRL